jgi:outer membrane protein
MKKSFSFFAVMILVFFVPLNVHSQINKEKIVFALFLDESGSRFDLKAENLKNKIKEFAEFNCEIFFPEKYIVKFHPEKAEQKAKKILKDKDVDIVLAAGPLSSSVFQKISVLEKPVISIYPFNPRVLSSKSEKSSSYNKNYYTIKSYPDIFSAAEIFYGIAGFEKIEVICEPYIADLIDSEKNKIKSDSGFDLSFVKTDKNPLKTIEKLNKKTDAVLISPLFSYSWKDFEILVSELHKRKIYTFSLYGNEEVRKGCLAGLENLFPDEEVKRASAVLAGKIISQKKPDKTKSFLKDPRLQINMTTAQNLMVSPDFDVLVNSSCFYQEEKTGETISLFDAIKFSLKNNQALKAAEKDSLKAEIDKNLSRSYMLPEAGIIGEGIARDEDSAYASFGQYPEKEVNLKFYVKQAVFDDEVFTGLARAKKVYLAAVEKEKAKQLEIAAKTASAYFDYLRAEKLCQIKGNDLELSKANLLKAKTKHQVGTKGPGDVYRWQSMTADAQKKFIRALKQKEQAMIVLEKITGEKFEESSDFIYPKLDSGFFWTDGKTFKAFSKNRAVLEHGKKILGKFAIENSPELKAYSKLIEAEEKNYNYLKRKHFVPKFYLKGQYLERLSRSGAGADGVSFDLAPGMPPFVIEEPKDNSWQIGIEAVLPIFTGLRDKNQALKSDEELKRLEIIKKDVFENIEKDIFLLAEEAVSSYLGINFAEKSKNAAKKNLDLVADAYDLGLADSLDLIDAQNSFTAADEALSVSKYEFMEKIYLIQARLGFEDFSDIPEKRQKIIELIGGKQ